MARGSRAAWVLALVTLAGPAGASVGPPLHELLELADRVVVGTVGRESGGSHELAVERVLKGAPAKTLEVYVPAGRRGQQGHRPARGDRGLWLLRGQGDGPLDRLDVFGERGGRPRPASEAELEKTTWVLAVQRRRGRVPRTEVLRLVREGDDELAAFGMSLVARGDPTRFLALLERELARGRDYHGELARAVLALPRERTLALAESALRRGVGPYRDRRLEVFAVVRQLQSDGALEEAPVRARMRRALSTRWRRGGSAGARRRSAPDPLIALLARLHDRSCAPIFEEALVYQPPGEPPRLDPWAARILAIHRGPALLETLRPFLGRSESVVQELLGVWGDGDDFELLLSTLGAGPPERDAAAAKALRSMVRRSGMTEPAFMIGPYDAVAEQLPAWYGWWEEHGAELRGRLEVHPAHRAAP